MALFVAFVLAYPVFAVPASADSTATTTGAMTPGRFGHASVWTGQELVVFGGHGCATPNQLCDEIVHIDMETGNSRVSLAKLPTPRKGMAAVWMGDHALLLGGWDGHDIYEVLRYDPVNGSLAPEPYSLPRAFVYGAAARLDAVYLFGGWGNPGILRVRPGPAGGVDDLGPMQAGPRVYLTAVAYDATTAYLMGGHDLTRSYNDVRVFRVSDPRPVDTSMRLFRNTEGASSAVLQGKIYVFGGAEECVQGSPCRRTSEIVEIDPSSSQVRVMPTRLPSARVFTAASTDGRDAFVSAGIYCQAATFCQDVVRYNPGPGAPQSVVATPGAEPGTVRVAWRAPASNTLESPVAHYVVMRGDARDRAVIGTPTGTDFVDASPGSGPQTYWVAAKNAQGEGMVSDPAVATPVFATPRMPLEATYHSLTRTVSLRWAPDGDPRTTHHVVSRGPEVGPPAPRVATLASADGFVDGPLGPGTYAYAVTSAGPLGVTRTSDVVLVTVPEDDATFSWPTSGPAFERVTQDFACRGAHCHSTTEFHAGLDVGAAGTPTDVRPMRGGTVESVYTGCTSAEAGSCTLGVGECLIDPPSSSCANRNGNQVVLRHEGGARSIYNHLAPGASPVAVGSRVEAGARLGTMGQTGQSTGVHLHLSLRPAGALCGYTAPHPESVGCLDPWKFLAPSAGPQVLRLDGDASATLTAHGAPSAGAPVVATLRGGQAYVATATTGAWWRIDIPCEGRSCAAWVAPSGGVSFSFPKDAPVVTVAGNGAVPIRLAASSLSLVVDEAWPTQRLVALGGPVPGEGCPAGWLRVHVPDEPAVASTGWVCAASAR